MNRVGGEYNFGGAFLRKIRLLLAVLFLSMLLAGCLSIPLGDGGKLEVSKDGVNVDVGEDEGSENEEAEEADMEGTEDAESTEGTDVDSDATTGEEGTEESEQVAAGSTSCVEPIEDTRGNDRALKQLAELAPLNFPLPDCTKIGSVTEGYYEPYEAATLDAYFEVEGYWADIFDLYTGYLEESGFGPLSKHEKAEVMTASLKGKSSDYEVTLEFRQQARDDGIELVEVRLILYHYDTPRDEE